MTPELADKIMTRIIARVEADGGVLHKSSGIEEIIGACAVAEAEGDDRVDPKGVTSEGFIGMVRGKAISADLVDLISHGISVHRIRLEDFKL